MKVISAVATVAILLLGCLSAGISFAASEGESIDLFTQKEPYSGRGLNATSDAFSPREEIEIHALVTRNGVPIEGVPVAFEVSGPRNSIENITFVRSGFTDDNGTAMFSFRLSYINTTNFGMWVVLGNAQIANVVVRDVLSFEVGWIVEITSVRTVDSEGVALGTFARGGYVYLEILMKSISLVEKRTTVAIAVVDCIGTEIGAKEVNNYIVPPNGTVLQDHFSVKLSNDACLGEATIYVGLYTSPVSLGGVPYSPEKSVGFLIIGRDVAILSVKASASFAYSGEIVHVDVAVANDGWAEESFDVKAYCNGTAIGATLVSDLGPLSNTTLYFAWNTEGFEEGIYVMSASAGPVPGETDLSDNVMTGDLVEIGRLRLTHDVAVLDVEVSALYVFIGETIDIVVLVRNIGDSAESFDVTVYGNSSSIAVLHVQDLQSGNQRSMTYVWNTSGLPRGNYTISAIAGSVPAEERLDDNLYVNGIVELTLAPAGWPSMDVFYWVLPVLFLIALILLVLLWLYRRRKKTEDSFYSGWTAWYYCCGVSASEAAARTPGA